MLSQLPKPELQNALRSSHHQPLAFLSGNFRESQLRWPIVDKEGYAIIQLYKVHHLIRGRRLHIFTDHRNLKYIWGGSPTTVSKTTSQRLQSWQGILGTLDYQIEHVPGEENHWGDMLSRWLGTDLSQRAIQLKLLRLNRGVVYDTTTFQLPRIHDLRNQQLDELEKLTSFDTEQIQLLCDELHLERDEELLLFRHKGKVWVPNPDTQISILVLAHQGAAGHRSVSVTQKLIENAELWWPAVQANVATFCASCLHCLDVGLGERVPRPLGEQLHGTRPFDVLHFDFVYIGDSNDGFQYVFCTHDDFSGLCSFTPSFGPTKEIAAAALISFFSHFGVARFWVSDGGSHFVNSVLEEFARLVGSEHHIVLAYSAWANGPAERMVKEFIRVLTALCSEHRLPYEDWPQLVPVVELVLNTVVSPLRGRSAIEIVTGRRDTQALTAILLRKNEEWNMEEIKPRKIQQYILQLRKHLDSSHQDVGAKLLRSRTNKRESSSKGYLPSFEPGIFVKRADILKTGKPRRKLKLRWTGPWRLIESETDWIWKVEHLVTGIIHRVHVSRLEFYADADMDVTEALQRQILYEEDGHFFVKRILDMKERKHDKTILVRVRWDGFSSAWDSWEELSSIIDQAATEVLDFLDTRSNTPLARRVLALGKIRSWWA